MQFKELEEREKVRQLQIELVEKNKILEMEGRTNRVNDLLQKKSV